MRPQETLSLIEEAAGTRMYESSKVDPPQRPDNSAGASKTLGKQKTVGEISISLSEEITATLEKQKTVDEISTLLSEEITPTLEKLQRERANYMLWVPTNNETEQLQRFRTAHEHVQVKQRLGSKTQQLDEMGGSVARLVDAAMSPDEREGVTQEEIKGRTAAGDKQRSQEFKRLEEEEEH